MFMTINIYYNLGKICITKIKFLYNFFISSPPSPKTTAASVHSHMPQNIRFYTPPCNPNTSSSTPPRNFHFLSPPPSISISMCSVLPFTVYFQTHLYFSTFLNLTTSFLLISLSSTSSNCEVLLHSSHREPKIMGTSLSHGTRYSLIIFAPHK